MITELERKTAAALHEHAATITTNRPPLDALLARDAGPLERRPRRWSTVRWAGAAAAVVAVAGVAATVIVLQRSPRDDAPATNPPVVTSTPAPPEVEASGFFAPSSVPDGFELTDVSAWVGADGPAAVSTETWLRRDDTGQVTDMIQLRATRPRVQLIADAPLAGDLSVHGLPAEGSSDSIVGSAVRWEEAGLELTVTAWGPDAVTIAEQSVVDAGGIALPAAAVPDGFIAATAHPDPALADRPSSMLRFSTDDPLVSITLMVVPNVLGVPLEGVTNIRGSRLQTVGGRGIWLSPADQTYRTASWLDGEAVLRASGPVDEATLLAFVTALDPIAAGDLAELHAQVSARDAGLPIVDRAQFTDGIAVSMRSAAPVGEGEPVDATTRFAFCIEGAATICSRVGPSTSDGRLDTASDQRAIAGQREYVVWVTSGDRVTRAFDPTSEVELVFETAAGAVGTFVRIQAPPEVGAVLLTVERADGSSISFGEEVARETLFDGVELPR